MNSFLCHRSNQSYSITASTIRHISVSNFDSNELCSKIIFSLNTVDCEYISARNYQNMFDKETQTDTDFTSKSCKIQ